MMNKTLIAIAALLTIQSYAFANHAWSTCQPSRCSQTGVAFSSWQECTNYVNATNQLLGKGKEKYRYCKTHK